MIDLRIGSQYNDFSDEINFTPISLDNENIQFFNESINSLLEKALFYDIELKKLFEEITISDNKFPFSLEEVDVFKKTFPQDASPKLDFLYGEIAFNFLIQDVNRLSRITQYIPFSKKYAWKGMIHSLKYLWNTEPTKIEKKLTNFASFYKDTLALESIYRDQDIFSNELNSLRNMDNVEKILNKMSFFNHFVTHYNKGEIIISYAFSLNAKLGSKLLSIIDNPIVCNYVLYSGKVRYDPEVLCEILEQYNYSTPSLIFKSTVFLCYIDYVDSLFDYFQAQDKSEFDNFLNVEAKSLIEKLTQNLKNNDSDETLRWQFLCYLSQKAFKDRHSKRTAIDQIYFDTFSKSISVHSMMDKLNEFNNTSKKLLENNTSGKFIHGISLNIYEFTALLAIYQNNIPEHFEMLSNVFVSILYSEHSKLFIPHTAEHIGEYPNSQDYLIAFLFLKSDSPAEAWCKVWQKIIPIRFRLSKNPYDEKTPRDAYNYILIIGIALFDWLLEKNFNNNLERNKLWDKLWEIIFTDWNTYRSYSSYSTVESLIVSLVVRKCVQDKDNPEKCAEYVIPYIKSIGDVPFLIAVIADTLNNNVHKETINILRPILEPSILQFIENEKLPTSKHPKYPKLVQSCKNIWKE